MLIQKSLSGHETNSGRKLYSRFTKSLLFDIRTHHIIYIVHIRTQNNNITKASMKLINTSAIYADFETKLLQETCQH